MSIDDSFENYIHKIATADRALPDFINQAANAALRSTDREYQKSVIHTIKKKMQDNRNTTLFNRILIFRVIKQILCSRPKLVVDGIKHEAHQFYRREFSKNIHLLAQEVMSTYNDNSEVQSLARAIVKQGNLTQEANQSLQSAVGLNPVSRNIHSTSSTITPTQSNSLNIEPQQSQQQLQLQSQSQSQQYIYSPYSKTTTTTIPKYENHQKSIASISASRKRGRSRGRREGGVSSIAAISRGFEVCWLEIDIGGEMLGVSENLDHSQEEDDECARNVDGYLSFLIRERDRDDQLVQDANGRNISLSEEFDIPLFPEDHFIHGSYSEEEEGYVARYRIDRSFRFQNAVDFMLTAKGNIAHELPEDDSMGSDRGERPFGYGSLDTNAAGIESEGYFREQLREQRMATERMLVPDPSTYDRDEDLYRIEVVCQDPVPTRVIVYGRYIADFTRLCRETTFPIICHR